MLSAVAIATLALGIGANTAIFSILNSLLLKQLPIRDPDRLIAVASESPGEDAALTYDIWQQVRDRHLLDEAFVWASDRLRVTNMGAAATDVEAIWASGRFFDTLGVPPVVGRTFSETHDRRGGGPGGPVAVISYAFAQRRFGGPAAALGSTLAIERVPFTVVGVTPPDFYGLNVGSSADVILPLETEPLLGRRPPRLQGTLWPWLHITARLASGDSLERASADMRAAQPEIRNATMPASARAEVRERYLAKAWSMRLAGTGSSPFRERYGVALHILISIVGVVLLLACANIANLQLAKTSGRRHEFSVRVALGASRWQIARQLLVESLVLSALGAALGLALAQWGSRAIVSLLSTWVSTAFLDLSPDWRVLTLTAGAMVASAALFGTVPAVRGSRADPMHALKRQGRGSAADAARMTGALVVAQVSMSLLLVVGAALFVRSFATLAYRDLGFDRGRVVVAAVDARRSRVPAENRMALYDRLRDAAAALPGVESAALSMSTPLGAAGIRFTPEFIIPASRTERSARVLTHPISPNWLRTFGTRLLAGRDVGAGDRLTSTGIALVNEAFARRYFAGASPLGRTLVETAPTGENRRPLEIVGLVQDAAFTSVRLPVEPTVYRPFAQFIEPAMLGSYPTISISVRSASATAPNLAMILSTAMGAVDPDASVSILTLNKTLDAHYVRERVLAMLSGFFAVLALVLAAVGLYGVTAHAVGSRRPEIGIRMALGADPRRIRHLVVRRVAWLSGAGIAIGLMASVWATRLVEALLFATPPRDPMTLAGCASLLAFVSWFAGSLPARRAARIDPAQALRDI
jgi:predicted permease